MDKRDFIKTLGALGLGGAVAHAFAGSTGTETVSSYISKHQQDYQAILDKGVIRAGYIVLPPEFQKDATTGKLSGIAFDIATMVAEKLNLRIDWVEETSFATMSEGLGRRFDALFFTLYRSTSFGRAVDFTQAFFYSGHSAYARIDDTRFDHSVEAINDPGITISTKDGDIASILASQRFPKARQLALPASAEHSQMLQDVITGKADIAMVNTIAADKFLAAQPGRLKNITAKEPLAVHGHAFVVAKGQLFLRELLDLALEELAHSGAIARILAAYEPYPDAYLRAAAPYKT